ncbi:MAG: hypothetical protein QOH48_1189 [Actinomycetota bacterium]|jgi:excisionase family DNA binding protein|nr:hypothetical protein [Actinomycetota bacterium]
MKGQPSSDVLTLAEVAALFRVDPKTVRRWSKTGKLTTMRTVGGHRRYLAEEVRRLLKESEQAAMPETGQSISGGGRESNPPTGDRPAHWF